MSAKKWLIIDAHQHFCPPEAAKQVGFADGMDFAARMKERGVCYQRAQDIELNIEMMDEAGIDMAVLNQAAWSACGMGVCRTMNNAYAAVAKSYPGRFIACAHIPLSASPEALNELDRAIQDLGLKGLSLLSSTSEYSLASEKLYPLYDRICKLDIPVVIHPTVRTPLYGGSSAIIGSGLSREYDIAKVTIEILLSLFKEFPDLKFLMPHYGGNILGFKYRVMAFYEADGAGIPEEIKGAAKSPRLLKQFGLDRAFDEVFNKFYFDTAGYGVGGPILNFATNTIKTDRLCLGTDYPFCLREAEDVKQFVKNIKKQHIAEAEQRNIAGENIYRLFQLG